jgi:hypothetical protein
MMRAVLLLATLCACTEPRSRRCQDVCAREAECRESVDIGDNFDEGECLDICAALERDLQMAEQVERHAECVAEAQLCEEVVACP